MEGDSLAFDHVVSNNVFRCVFGSRAQDQDQRCLEMIVVEQKQQPQGDSALLLTGLPMQ